MKNVIFVILFITSIFTTAQTQESFQFQHYGVDDGLSQSRVEAIFEDSRGYLWIGTPNGLNKFNGHEFKVYLPSKDSSQTSLSHQAVYEITEDNKGNIWLGTRKGVSKFNPETQQFTNFSEVGDCKGCLAGTITKAFFSRPAIYVCRLQCRTFTHPYGNGRS